MGNVQVTLYTKLGCHLCETVTAKLVEIQKTHPFELTEINIVLDPKLQVQYGLDIPVVVVNGEQFSTHFLNEAAFLKYIGKVSNQSNENSF